MAETRSESAIAWLWAIEYLATLKYSSLSKELFESAPDNVRRTVGEMLKSPLPTKCALELLKEQLVVGLISDDLLKKRSGLVTEQVNSRGGKEHELAEFEGNNLMEDNGDSARVESSARLNQYPTTNNHQVQTAGGDLNVQETESIEDDVVILETLDANGCEMEQTVEAGAGDGDLDVQRTESIEDDDEVVLQEIPDANASGQVPSNPKEPSTRGKEHKVETSRRNHDGEEILEGNKLVKGHHDDSVRKESSSAHADKGVQNCQQPSSAGIDRPHGCDDRNYSNQVKSGGNQPTEGNPAGSSFVDPHTDDQVQTHQTETEHHSLIRSNENGEELVSRKRRLNDFLKGQQSWLPVVTSDLAEPNLCGKCHRPGASLVCSSVNCHMMLHRDCLGFDSADSGEGRDFYCPLCGYSRAVAELHEAQRRVALSQNNLSVFVDLFTRRFFNN